MQFFYLPIIMLKIIIQELMQLSVDLNKWLYMLY